MMKKSIVEELKKMYEDELANSMSLYKQTVSVSQNSSMRETQQHHQKMIKYYNKKINEILQYYKD